MRKHNEFMDEQMNKEEKKKNNTKQTKKNLTFFFKFPKMCAKALSLFFCGMDQTQSSW